MTSDSVQSPASLGQRLMLLGIQHADNLPELAHLHEPSIWSTLSYPTRTEGFAQ